MTDSEQKRIFAKNLNRYINESGHTQKEIANALGIGVTTFNNWCCGKSMPGMGTVQKIAGFFNIKFTELIDEHTAEDEEEKLIEQYLQDEAIRRFVLYAGGMMPKDSRGRFIEAMIQAYEATHIK